MKSKLIWVSFILLLYIGPMIFSLSTEYETSDESITSFAETLPDDVLFYPDSDNTLVQNEWDDWDTDSGSLAIKYNDYNATKTNTTTEYDPSASGGIQPSDSFVMAWGYRFSTNTVEVQFNFTLPSVYTSLTLNTIMSGSADSNTLATSNNGSLAGGWYIRVWNWDTSSYVQLDYKNSGLTWGYSTALDIDNADYFDNATRTVMIKYSVYASDLYVGIWIYSSSITLGWTDYTESFADVSDWVEYGIEQPDGDSWSTDGDVLSIEGNNDGSNNDYDGVSYNISTFVSDSVYVELRYRLNHTSFDRAYVFLWSTETAGGDKQDFQLTKSTSWTTCKVILSPYDLKYITVTFRTDIGQSAVKMDVDYLRIGNSTSMGWQHDGSTTAGVTQYAGTVSSDGDVVSVKDATTACAIFWVDDTSTKSRIESDYYLFVGVDVVNVNATKWSFGYPTVTNPSVWGDFTWILSDEVDSGIFRFNIKSLGIDPLGFAVLSEYGTVEVNWTKAHSIANFTVTQSGVGTDDYLYVSDGVLYSHIDDGYIEANYDPALSVDTEIDGMWNLTTGSGTPQSDYYVDAWAGYSSETEGYLASGTLTDFKLKFTDDANVAAVTFLIAPPQWYEVSEAELLFTVPIDETGLDMLLIFLGLIMIPLSTLYLVKGGRSEMSSDKLFYGLIAFTIGWALFLGGIMP